MYNWKGCTDSRGPESLKASNIGDEWAFKKWWTSLNLGMSMSWGWFENLDFGNLDLGRCEVYLQIAVENLSKHDVNLWWTARQLLLLFFKAYDFKTLKKHGKAYVIRDSS